MHVDNPIGIDVGLRRVLAEDAAQQREVANVDCIGKLRVICNIAAAQRDYECFNPLIGINFVRTYDSVLDCGRAGSFNPLIGINFVRTLSTLFRTVRSCMFQSPNRD